MFKPSFKLFWNVVCDRCHPSWHVSNMLLSGKLQQLSASETQLWLALVTCLVTGSYFAPLFRYMFLTCNLSLSLFVMVLFVTCFYPFVIAYVTYSNTLFVTFLRYWRILTVTECVLCYIVPGSCSLVFTPPVL